MEIEKFVQNSLLLAIGSSYDTILRDLNFRLREENCNLLQALILISLFFEKEEPVSPSKLAETLGTTRGNISHGISHLEKHRLLRRKLNDKDARSYLLVLRPEGRRLAVRLIKTIDSVENYFERKFGAQEVRSTVQKIARFRAAYTEAGNILPSPSV
jgi:DNA-binding MarR family transcriptional regulator